MKPWFTRWLRANTGLESADFSLAAWLQVQNGEIAGATRCSSRGGHWDTGAAQHRLDVDNLALSLRRQGTGWELDVPQLRLSTDGQAWPQGTLPPCGCRKIPSLWGRRRMKSCGCARLTFSWSACRRCCRPSVPQPGRARSLERSAATGDDGGLGAGHSVEPAGKELFPGAVARCQLAALGTAAGRQPLPGR